MPVNFEILVDGIDDDKIPQEDKEPWYAFFRDAAMKMNVPLEDLENILIADPKNWATAIAKVRGSSPPSSSGGIDGNTLSRLYRDGRVKCSIVFPWQTFEQLRIALATAITVRTPPEQLVIYVVYHELGHCVDDLTRKDLTEIERDPEGPSQSTRDHILAIRGEYAACFYAAANVSQELYNFLEITFQYGWNIALPLIKDAGTEYKKRVGAIWVQMSEYAKLAAHRAGNPSLASRVDLGVFETLFAEWESVLANDWKNYHNWLAEEPNGYDEISHATRSERVVVRRHAVRQPYVRTNLYCRMRSLRGHSRHMQKVAEKWPSSS
jgi:hypothetical protein